MFNLTNPLNESVLIKKKVEFDILFLGKTGKSYSPY
jgi:hypothetical protein